MVHHHVLQHPMPLHQRPQRTWYPVIKIILEKYEVHTSATIPDRCHRTQDMDMAFQRPGWAMVVLYTPQ